MVKVWYALVVIVLVLTLFSSAHIHAQSNETTYTNLIEETSDAFTWKGIWVDEKSPAASGGTWRASGNLGDRVDVSFYGKGVSLIYAKGPNAPEIAATIDGTSYGIIDASSPTKIAGVKRLIAEDLIEKQHLLTFKIINPGKENGFVVDAVEVITTKPPEVKASKRSFMPILLLIILVVGGTIGVTYLRNRTLEKEKAVAKMVPQKIPQTRAQKKIVRVKTVIKTVPVKTQLGKMILPQRALDVMKTLDKRDQSIIKYLAENNGKAMQNKVRHAVSLPRSTMTKRVQILQSKNILSVREMGKINSLELTAWFLEKE